MTAHLPDNERLLDLLCEDACRGLDDADRRELDAADLDGTFDGALPAEFDRAVAALDAAFTLEDLPAPPAAVRSALDRAAAAFAADPNATDSTDSTNTVAEPKLRLAGTPADANAAQAGSSNFAPMLGWLAAAACLAIAVAGWWPGASTPPAPNDTAGNTPGDPLAQLTPAERYDALAAKAGVVKTTWVGLDDLGLTDTPHQYDDELAGEVIFDADTQTGYMKFVGLASNDPTELQYQLWIFDAARPTGDLPQFAIDGMPDLLTQRPVDGGVFDIADAALTDAGEIIIPIDAKLRVDQATIFAITVEPPGGVVVSDRDIVTAAIAG